MVTLNIADTLDGLSNETRLDIFRLLVREGGGDGVAVVIAVIPAYPNGYAAIPLVHSLIDPGMPASTGLAFMLAASMTSISAAIAIFSLAKTRLYNLFLVARGASVFLAGLTWQLAG